MKKFIRKIKRKARSRSFSDPVENEKMMSALSYKSSGGKVMKKKTKGYEAGGKMKAKGMKAGGKMPMVKKGGEMVPAFAADGVGKMMAGGKTGGMKISPKMMANVVLECRRRRRKHSCSWFWCRSTSKVHEERIDGY